jgi:predicted RecB family nuclease
MRRILLVLSLGLALSLCLAGSLYANDSYQTRQDAVDASYATAFQNHKTYLGRLENADLYIDIEKSLEREFVGVYELVASRVRRGNFFTKREYLVFQWRDSESKLFTWIFG